MKSANRCIKLPSEVAYILSILILSLAVAMTSATNFGVSMIVAPAYIVSQKWPILTFGQAEYVVQGLLFVVFCLLMKRVKPIYFCSFLTGLIYGTVLDLWRLVVPHFNPTITQPGALPMPLKIVYFLAGMVLTAFSIALLFHTYIYPQVYDFFVKGISEVYHLDRTKFKMGFDMGCLLVSVAMTLLLFGRFVGVGIGTLVLTCFNGMLIGFFDKWITRHMAITPAFPKLAAKFSLS